MLVQLDGSQHAWLEDRGTKFALLLAVDDATGAVANAVFCTGEDTRGYLMLLEGLIQRWGIPWRSTAIAMPSSSTTPASRRRRRKPPSSLVACRNRGSGRSSPAHPGPKAGWSAGQRSFRIDWSPNCAWRMPGPSTRPRRCCRTSSLVATPVSTWSPSIRNLPTAWCRRNFVCPRSCASSTPARSPGTTRCSITGGSCNAARCKTSQLRWTAGGGTGTTRRPTHRPVPRAYGGHVGTTAAYGRTVGWGQPPVARA